MRVAQPQEGCALLLGRAGPVPEPSAPRSEADPDGIAGVAAPRSARTGKALPAWEIRLIWPCLNVWEPAVERCRRFRLDPREQLLAQRWGRERGLQVLGSAHSHPCSDPVPSATDLELAFAPVLELILSPLARWAPSCWWLEVSSDGGSTPRPLQWRMVD